jgi:hypothetical protein
MPNDNEIEMLNGDLRTLFYHTKRSKLSLLYLKFDSIAKSVEKIIAFSFQKEALSFHIAQSQKRWVFLLNHSPKGLFYDIELSHLQDISSM